MIDKIFFNILLPLPLIVAVAMVLYLAGALRTSTPALRRARIGAALWLGVCAGILLFCRERVRGWTGMDIGTVSVFMIASAGVIVLIGNLIGLFATIGRSSGGAPLCPRCWYDMDGVDPQVNGRSVCPECGTEVWNTSDLIRRKRWPIFISVAVAFQLAGQFSYQVIRADHGGAQNFIPTTALIAGMLSLPSEAIIGPPSPFDVSTLSGRLANNKTADWQKSWAIGKAIDAIARAENPEAVARASTILNRCGYDGELPFEAWKASVMLLSRESAPRSGEAFAYLAECFVRARSSPERSGRLAFPRDPVRCSQELAGLVPLLVQRVSTAPVRTQEFWSSLRLLALAGEAASPVVDYLERRMLVEDSESGRANAAAILAMFGPILPAASDAAVRSFALLAPPEQPRVLNAIARYVYPSLELLPSFRALSVCGEPTLEVAGAVSLLGRPETRCEGAEKLIEVVRRHSAFGYPDLGSLYWPVTRFPDDGASTTLIVFLEELALTASPMIRVDAMAHLSNIARDVDSRSSEILAFLDFASNDRDAEMASRARTMAIDIRTARSAPVQIRKVAIIR